MSSTGMLVETAIQESQYRGLTESLCRALQGDAIASGTISYEQQTYSADPPYGTTGDLTLPYDTNYDLEYAQLTIAEGATDIEGTYATLLAGTNTAPTWGSIPNSTQAWVGWQMEIGGSFFTIYTGLVKNTTTSVQPYFIVHLQQGFSIAGSPTYIDAGVTTFWYAATIVATGFALPNQIMGVDQDIPVIFPTSIPWPPASITNNGQASDLYILVMGKNPDQWAYAPPGVGTSITFGTNTAVS